MLILVQFPNIEQRASPNLFSSKGSPWTHHSVHANHMFGGQEHLSVVLMLVLSHPSRSINSHMMVNNSLIFKGSPKVWFSYMKEFLFRYSNSLDSCYNLFCSVNRIPSLVVVLNTSKNISKVRKHHDAPNCNDFYLISDSLYCTLKGSMIVWRVSGQLQNYLPRVPFNPDAVSYKYSYTWAFSLDHTLSLNLTFLTLFFSTLSGRCSSGNLVIFSNQSLFASRFQYCGAHSVFRLFPGFQKNILALTTVPCTVYKLDIFFVAVDINSIRSLSNISLEKNYFKLIG